MTASYVADVHDFPTDQTLDPDEGWIDMQVQFLIDAAGAGSTSMVVGRTIFPPGASSHEYHRHPGAEEFVYVVRGRGVVMNGDEEIPVRAGHIAFHPRGVWHGFRNTSETEETELIWAWSGGASRDEAGYEVRGDQP